uniref:Uncharacterized protein n=1 Tax=Aegilops tauschii subsp. strangulata TaxID=200361 RepID=A0A452Y5H9_AEGTS
MCDDPHLEDDRYFSLTLKEDYKYYTKLPRVVLPAAMDATGVMTIICHQKTNFKGTYLTANPRDGCLKIDE